MRALFPFDAKGVFGHVNLRDGEEVMEVTPDKTGWTVVRKEGGEEGAVPTTYLGTITKKYNVYFTLLLRRVVKI